MDAATLELSAALDAYCEIGLDDRQGADRMFERVSAALSAGADPRIHNNLALRASCMMGRRGVASQLVALGLTAADVRAHRCEALRMACWFGHVDVLDVLLAAPVGLTPADAMTDNAYALRWACWNGHLGALDRLLRFGVTADDVLNCNDIYGDRPYSIVNGVCWYGHADILDRLMEAGLRSEDLRTNGDEAMAWARAQGHVAVVNRLLSYGVPHDMEYGVPHDME